MTLYTGKIRGHSQVFTILREKIAKYQKGISSRQLSDKQLILIYNERTQDPPTHLINTPDLPDTWKISPTLIFQSSVVMIFAYIETIRLDKYCPVWTNYPFCVNYQGL